MGHWKTADYKPKFEDRFFGFLFYLVANFLFFLVSRYYGPNDRVGFGCS